MKTFVKKNKIKIVFAVLLIFVIYKILTAMQSEKIIKPEPKESRVEIFEIEGQKTGSLESFCQVEAITDSPVVAEYSGKVTYVYKKDGEDVTKGQKLFSLENIQQRVAVANAQSALKSAQLALAELLKDNDESSQLSLVEQTKSQQTALVTAAKNAYFNTDLRAYPEDNDETTPGPTISGNYTCKTEGEYIINVYGSAASSGASMDISGLESTRSSVSTDFSQKFGNCGLEIVFPKNFRKNRTWIVPVPNTRSGSYTAVKSAYLSAQSGKDIAINNTQASPEQIARERARVTQARLQLESAYDSLSKTVIKAASSGVLSGFDIDKGDFISPHVDLARIKSIGDLELVSYVNSNEKDYLAVGNKAFVDGNEISVIEVSPALDTHTKKLKVTLDTPKDNSLVEGTEISCQIERNITLKKDAEKDSVIIPLSAVSIIGQDAFVFEIIDGLSIKKTVELGALLGKDIVVYGLKNTSSIIRDARGVRDGESVKLK